jgi:hypothetical protein
VSAGGGTKSLLLYQVDKAQCVQRVARPIGHMSSCQQVYRVGRTPSDKLATRLLMVEMMAIETARARERKRIQRTLSQC